MKVVLTIAGSNSSGGAGIQADLKTFEAFGVFGTSAITVLTTQNTMGVQAIFPFPLILSKRKSKVFWTILRSLPLKSECFTMRKLLLWFKPSLHRLPSPSS
jgi:hydroxymethylpyrimidine/phosphomethylpyrimidine kinase